MIENEIAVIGSVLVDPACFSDVATILSADHFENHANRLIFNTVRKMKNESKPIDILTVYAEGGKEMAAAFGLDYLMGLIEKVPTALHAAHYAGLVRESSRLRRVSQLSEMLARSPGDVNTAQKLREAILDTGLNKSTSIGMREAVNLYTNELDRRLAKLDPVFGTGFETLDKICSGGLRPGQLITIGARTSKGKSSMLLQMALSIAANGGRVLFHSQEMSIAEMLDRVVSLNSSLSVGQVRVTNKKHLPEILESVGKFSSLPIRWGNQKAFGMDAFAADIEREKPDVLVVDYLQRIPVGHRDNRAAHYSDVANGLKTMALQNKTVIITASQLSRSVEVRDDHTPTLADLKESGGIEEASDIVLLVHTPEEDLMNGTRDGHLLVAKNRNGATMPIPITFEMAKTKFYENVAGKPRPGSEPFA